MRGGIRQDSEKKRRGASTIRRKSRQEGESGVVWTPGEHDVASGRKKRCDVASGRKIRCDVASGLRNVATLRQDVRNVATQVRTHRTHATQTIRRLHQDAAPADQTQDPFLLMSSHTLSYSDHSLDYHLSYKSKRRTHLSRICKSLFLL